MTIMRRHNDAKEELKVHLRKIYCDPERERPLEDIEGLIWPSAPGFKFNKPSTLDKVNSCCYKGKSDSLWALQAVQSNKIKAIEIRRLDDLIRKFLSYVHNSVAWISTHVGIRGNENVVGLAKAVLNTASSSKKKKNICGSDLKPCIHTIWQENWDVQVANKFHEVLPNLGEDLSKRGEGAGTKRETVCLMFTMVSEDVEIEKFYEEIEAAKGYLNPQDIIIAMVDFNAKVEDERVEDVVGPSGIETVNDRGMWSKLEIRAVVRVLFAKGTKCSIIYREIVENYGEHAMSMTQVHQWCSWFKDGRTSLQDEPRSGRLNTANNDWNTA
ncbi:histone-lysine N-methyltransferase SETMAR [Plakobranchus ocellatus]|uniref:Histone-lysine N-methyltransferase SETMAR n=1 Tax=Plakobranchus ocellatus TaxID=259542 RepID=A0AAV4AHR6_9GAST|nr:histone-lysine N-methyltransferase SETMAR [Plakobranchus ocellatus]